MSVLFVFLSVAGHWFSKRYAAASGELPFWSPFGKVPYFSQNDGPKALTTSSANWSACIRSVFESTVNLVRHF